MKKKNLAALLMAGVMCFGLLAGCSNSSGETSNPPASQPGSQESQPSGDSGNAGQGSDVVTIKVGGIGPITGDLAQYGTATQWGAQIAVDEINAMNGPIRLEYDFQDDTGVAETGVAAYNPGQGTAAAEYLKNAGLGTKIGVIYNNGDAYSTGIADAFIAHAKELGLEVVAAQTYPDDKTTDYTVQLNACKDAGADLVFLPIYYTPASLILAQAKQMSYAPIFFGGDGMDGMLDMEGFNKSLAEGLLLMTPFNASGTDERTKTFVETYQAAHEILPNQFAADGYDCMYAIYEACCQLDGIADMDSAQLCDALIALFTGGDFSVDGLTGTSMKWLESGEVSKAPVVVKVVDGVYVIQ